jgi:ribokinase
VAILTPNETEAELLTGLTVTDERSAASAAKRLLATGPRSAVITLGGRGALVAEAAATDHVAGYEVTPVDTVAAGDVFNGCLAVAIAGGKSLVEASRFANAAAAIAVTRHGAQASAPRRDEIFRFQSSREGLPS